MNCRPWLLLMRVAVARTLVVVESSCSADYVSPILAKSSELMRERVALFTNESSLLIKQSRFAQCVN